jgi:hypothetical protein
MINLKEFLGLGYYTSELDEFLKNYDKNHPKFSASQRSEIEKYQRIYHLRDDPQAADPKKTTFWDKF